MQEPSGGETLRDDTRIFICRASEPNVPNRNGDVYPEGVQLKILKTAAEIDPVVAKVLETKRARIRSMGCVADRVQCSACGKTFTEQPWCEHLNSEVTQFYRDALAQIDVADVLEGAILGVTYHHERSPMPSKSPFPEFTSADVLAFKQEQRVIFTRDSRAHRRLTFYCTLDDNYIVERGYGDSAVVLYRGNHLDTAVSTYLDA